MRSGTKESRFSQIIIAVLAIILGVLCVARPDKAAGFIVSAVGLIILIVGIVMIVSKLKDNNLRVPAIILGAVIATIGIFIFTHPDQTISLIFIAFGVLLVADSIQGITSSMVIKEAGGPWSISLTMALISFVFGVICFMAPKFFPSLSFMIIGIMLIYDGVTSIYSSIRAGRADKSVVDSHIVDEKDI
ncbi:MAG: DUF308 domain-containing protein [Lachnospiraceae bacterium]|nr:DUF308 domain-containing protein [Lachnospiraceae bacterium]